jgi:hypothetical protein
MELVNQNCPLKIMELIIHQLPFLDHATNHSSTAPFGSSWKTSELPQTATKGKGPNE